MSAWTLAPKRPGAFELRGVNITLLLKRIGYTPKKASK